MNRHALFQRTLFAFVIAVAALAQTPAWGWGKGHLWIREWAVGRLPEWQVEYFGPDHLDDLCLQYKSLQDIYAGSRSPELRPYCEPPGERISLHDVNAVEPTYLATTWYLEKICEEMQSGRRDEAMKYLGVLCHWNEDPGSLSAHSSRVREAELRELVPPRPDLENSNYLFGAGWIGFERQVGLEDVDYEPQLLGSTIKEAAVQITHRQELLRRHAAGLIVQGLLGYIERDEERLHAAIGSALAYNARYVADIIYTTGCLAAGQISDSDASPGDQPLTEWLPPHDGGKTSAPYYVHPYILNQAMDAERQLHPLALPDDQRSTQIAHGLGMGTPYQLKFRFASDGLFKRFTVEVGLHPTAGENGAVRFVVSANNTELARTRAIRAGEPGELIDFELPATPTVELILETIAAADSAPTHNLTVWAEPTLHQ